LTRQSPNQPAVEVIHFADPWCWWSWGLEPVLNRLREVYGEQIAIKYRMGGMADRIADWMQDYGVDDQGLVAWMKESIELTRMPTDIHAYRKTSVKSSTPACLAVKAAELQGEERAERFLRRLMEAIMVEARNGSDQSVIGEIAAEAGLDAARLLRDMTSKAVAEALHRDQHAMHEAHVNFLSLLLRNRKGDAVKVGEVFAAKPYEEAIERLTDGRLAKRMPVDVLAYLEHHRSMVPAREIAEVFGTTDEDAAQRLARLAKSGLLEEHAFEAGTFWRLSNRSRDSLTPDEVATAHIAPQVGQLQQADARAQIVTAVRNLYTEVATHPDKAYHFPLGRKAALYVGYPAADLDRIPATAVESFAGVGHPFAANVIQPGDRVLDIGSGSGTDVLVAALKTGPEGRVTGLDFTDGMIAKARANIAKAKAKNVKIVEGNAERIPFEEGSFDVVTTNGVLNLVPDKKQAMREIYRVLRSGGRLQLADIVVQEDVAGRCGLIPQLWADCIGGAAVEKEYLRAIRDVGFQDMKILRRLDYFDASSSQYTKRLTKTFGAESVVISARKA
jgi:ubiquinone/menaquinone biosynthesis C-methylase UbiE/predicted DsbA family dithiol-disulfide isomerase